LGETQARRLVAEGGRVVIGDVLVDVGQRLAAELGPACTFQSLDVTIEAQWREAVAVAERIGTLHGLVNNAGVYTPVSMLDTDTAQFERHTRINQLGTFLGMRAVVPALERTGL
jgi:3alpha(or 20beta)-hydroxysteroid dehydrogenase